MAARPCTLPPPPPPPSISCAAGSLPGGTQVAGRPARRGVQPPPLPRSTATGRSLPRFPGPRQCPRGDEAGGTSGSTLAQGSAGHAGATGGGEEGELGGKKGGGDEGRRERWIRWGRERSLLDLLLFGPYPCGRWGSYFTPHDLMCSPCARQPNNPELVALMEVARKLASSAASAALAHRNDSVRVSGAKLRESTVLLFTADTAPSLLGERRTAGWKGKGGGQSSRVACTLFFGGGSHGGVGTEPNGGRDETARGGKRLTSV